MFHMLLPLLLLTTTQFGPGTVPLELHHHHVLLVLLVLQAPPLDLVVLLLLDAHHLYKHIRPGAGSRASRAELDHGQELDNE